MLLHVHPENPQKRILTQVAEGLKKGGVYIVPTDSVYAFVASLENKKAVEKIYALKELPPSRRLSLFCRDFSQASEYIRQNDNRAFKWIKQNLPGPYTLIFNASKKLPQYTLSKQKTVGIRIIDHPVISGILDLLGSPLIGSSVMQTDGYLTYPDDLEDIFGKRVEGIVDTGPFEPEVSTILDATSWPFELIREGRGEVEVED